MHRHRVNVSVLHYTESEGKRVAFVMCLRMNTDSILLGFVSVRTYNIIIYGK